MKIAITGKGGVGKTTLAATLANLFVLDNFNVIALDADPDANLAQTLGISEEKQKNLIPIAEMKELINERTGKDEQGAGSFFRLNPKVDDITDKYAFVHNGIKLLILGKIRKGGSGCYCPESVFLRNLLSHLIVQSKDIVIVDMEAGIEHLTRGSSRYVDFFIVVIEPGSKSLHTAKTIYRLAKDLGVNNIYAVGNKITKTEEKEFLEKSIPKIPFLGFIPYKEKIVESDIKSIPPYDNCPELIEEVKKIKKNLLEKCGKL